MYKGWEGYIGGNHAFLLKSYSDPKNYHKVCKYYILCLANVFLYYVLTHCHLKATYHYLWAICDIRKDWKSDLMITISILNNSINITRVPKTIIGSRVIILYKDKNYVVYLVLDNLNGKRYNKRLFAIIKSYNMSFQ